MIIFYNFSLHSTGGRGTNVVTVNQANLMQRLKLENSIINDALGERQLCKGPSLLSVEWKKKFIHFAPIHKCIILFDTKQPVSDIVVFRTTC